MDPSRIQNNPFVSLFPSVEVACSSFASNEEFAFKLLQSNSSKELSLCQDAEPVTNSDDDEGVLVLNDLIEHVFLITLDKTNTSDTTCCVYLEELHEALKGQTWIDLSILQQAVFERMMLTEPLSHIINKSHNSSLDEQFALTAAQSNVLFYLCECYIRMKKVPFSSKKCSNLSWIARMQTVIITNGVFCFENTDVFDGLNIAKVFLDIFDKFNSSRDAEIMYQFFEFIAEEINNNASGLSVFDAFKPILSLILEKMFALKLGHPDIFRLVYVMIFFTHKNCLAEVFLKFIEPVDWEKGSCYEDTLLGKFLSISCIPTVEIGPFEFFDQASRFSQQEHSITESQIHQPISLLNQQIYQVIFNILKLRGENNNGMMTWLSKCLNANKGRSKMWSSLMPNLYTKLYASDGFFLNLCAVLLHIAKPFSIPLNSKLLKINPQYCQESADRDNSKFWHGLELSKETCLVPKLEDANFEPETQYGFICEVFFLTHFAIHLGYRVTVEKFMKKYQHLHRIQELYRDIISQGGAVSDAGNRVKEQMEKGMSVYLCIKAALTEPHLLENSFNFLIATTTYLVHVATYDDFSVFKDITFPLPNKAPLLLHCIPEFVSENVIDFLIFLRRFKDSVYESAGDNMKHLMTFIIVFMGNPDLMHNPHLRARLAESLEALVPSKSDMKSFTYHQKELLFKTHKLANHVSETLIHVFVSIEMTGASVQFEQKFNYRRPMYNILKYLWDVDSHKHSIVSLANNAELNINDADPPLFLRFINLLMNDAIFLLDEALDYMKQIRQKIEEQESGSWNQLPSQQRQENEESLQQITMFARFHNIMGLETINTLKMLTEEIRSIFVSDVLIDRLVSMLNYFLLCLIGSKSKELKVKDFKKYEFKPQELVSGICQIYLNFSKIDSFCIAITRDGRSYSDELFVEAQKVLMKINQSPQLIMDLREFSENVKQMSLIQKQEEELLDDAPEEYLDPILGTIMKDPVILPSGVTVDRSTIARHLLSDQSDPFNRQPMSMDSVKSHTELQISIDNWILKKYSKKQ